MNKNLRNHYLIAVLGYLALLATLAIWPIVFQQQAKVPVAIKLIVLVLPLLIPLRGLLHARIYTYRWTLFMALFYFLIGVVKSWEAIAVQGQLLSDGPLVVIFSLLWFTGNILFIRSATLKPSSQTE